MILLDTDHLSIVLTRRFTGHENLVERLRGNGGAIAIPVICVEEQCKGWLAQINRLRDVHKQIPAYERFRALFDFFKQWDIQPFDAASADAFNDFRKQRIRVGTQDLKIGAIAVTQGALLLSANLRDFRQIPGLRVENWLEA
jgi:tRNA(fMet)-specific endonuclease VapC